MARFSNEALRRHVLVRLMSLESAYHRAAGRRLDPDNGTAQIPRGNTEAAEAYGEWCALARLLDAVQGGEVT
jgi:hypothetical protein